MENFTVGAASFILMAGEEGAMTNNSFFVNNMTKSWEGYMQSQLSGGHVKGAMGFKDVVTAVGSKGEADAYSTADMTLDEYKQYIYQKISRIPMNPSQTMRSVAIHISDAGFEAMQKDPQYEKWVLDTLKYDFAYYDPWSEVCGESFTIHRFGATREEYRADSWYTGYQKGRGRAIYEKEAEESFWEKRSKRFKKYMKFLQEAEVEEKIMRRVYQEACIRRGDFENMGDYEGMAQVLPMAKLLLRADRKVN